MNTFFKIIVPVYNSEEWIQKCLSSVTNQTYTNWEMIVINDASTDNTLGKIVEFVENTEYDGEIRIFNRSSNVSSLENIIYGIKQICTSYEDVIVLIDGDDWLYSNDVLEYLDTVYEDKHIWLTHGQYITESKKSVGNNKPLIDTKTYRQRMNYCTSHLRTFKYKLWRLIKDNDFRDTRGEYYKVAGDFAYMFPMIEMCGLKRIKYVDKIMYVYNDINPLNDFRKRGQLQLLCDKEIRRKPMYKEINNITMGIHTVTFDIQRSALHQYLVPTRFVWESQNNDIKFFVDEKIYDVSASNANINIAWLIEPPSIIGPLYDWIKINYSCFDYVLTHYEDLLNIDPKFVWYPHGGCWISSPDMQIYPKSQNISMIVSNKTVTIGHSFRHKIVAKFADKIDYLCGRAYLPIESKLVALKDFRYSIVVENGQYDSYFTEKLIDCLVTGTVPIYWGGHVNKFFDMNGIITFSDMDQLEDILGQCTEEDYIRRLPAIKTNFELAKQYLIVEDWIYDNIIENIKI